MKAMWTGVSGYIESKDPLIQALKEIEEETGLSNEKVKLVCIGRPLEAVEDDKPDIIWIVHTYLFSSNTNVIRPIGSMMN